MYEASAETLQCQIAELRRAIDVSGIAADSLMGKMLQSSLQQIDRAYESQDFETAARGLESTRVILCQCTI